MESICTHQTFSLIGDFIVEDHQFCQEMVHQFARRKWTNFGRSVQFLTQQILQDLLLLTVHRHRNL